MFEDNKPTPQGDGGGAAKINDEIKTDLGKEKKICFLSHLMLKHVTYLCSGSWVIDILCEEHIERPKKKNFIIGGLNWRGYNNETETLSFLKMPISLSSSEIWIIWLCTKRCIFSFCLIWEMRAQVPPHAFMRQFLFW